jgi:hypothetical protein
MANLYAVENSIFDARKLSIERFAKILLTENKRLAFQMLIQTCHCIVHKRVDVAYIIAYRKSISQYDLHRCLMRPGVTDNSRLVLRPCISDETYSRWLTA